VHYVAVAFDEELVCDLDGADGGDATDIVAAKIRAASDVRPVLSGRSELFLECLVLVRRRHAARTSPGNGTDREASSDTFTRISGLEPATAKSPKSRK
jgi:hypothetical protein